MALVDAAEPEEWKDLAVRTGVYLAYTLPDFTSDEFYKHIPRPEHRTAMGPIMKKLERHGYIFNTMTMRLSESSTNHRRGQTVWKSKVYGKPMPQHVVDYLGLPEGG